MRPDHTMYSADTESINPKHRTYKNVFTFSWGLPPALANRFKKYFLRYLCIVTSN
jgi:hypothetical protein